MRALENQVCVYVCMAVCMCVCCVKLCDSVEGRCTELSSSLSIIT